MAKKKATAKPKRPKKSEIPIPPGGLRYIPEQKMLMPYNIEVYAWLSQRLRETSDELEKMVAQMREMKVVSMPAMLGGIRTAIVELKAMIEQNIGGEIDTWLDAHDITRKNDDLHGPQPPR